MRSRRIDQIKNQLSAANSLLVPGLLQRKSSSSTDCEEYERSVGCKRLQTDRSGVAEDGRVPNLVHDTLRTPGQSLAQPIRTLMESSFGRDFSGVRIHTDRNSAESAEVINARAYSYGQHIVFGTNEYQPHTASGQRLLAHELVHTVQQFPLGLQLPNHLTVAPPANESERNAEQVAALVHTDSLESPYRRAQIGDQNVAAAQYPVAQLAPAPDRGTLLRSTRRPETAYMTRPPRQTPEQRERERRQARRQQRCDIMAERNDSYCFRIYSSSAELDRCLNDVDYNHQQCIKRAGHILTWGAPECAGLMKPEREKCLNGEV